MTPREIVIEQIHHRETADIPYTLAFAADVGSRLDEYFDGDAWRVRLVQYISHCGSVAKLKNERLDDTHHRDAFGTVWRTDQLPPSVVEPGLLAPSFQGYAFPSAETFMDPTVTATVKQRVDESSSSFTIVSPGLCLWQSWYLRGFQNTLMDCVAEEDFYAELLDRFTELCLALVAECADVPADAIMMGDDWGHQRGVMIGPQRWRRYFKPRYARIFDAVHAQGKIAIMHSCGSVADIMGDSVDIGLDVLESVQPEAAGMNPYTLKREWGDQITFWGGLGSQYTIPFATPADIRQEIRCLRHEMGGGGYILAPAKPLRVETPTENAVAVVEEFLAGSDNQSEVSMTDERNLCDSDYEEMTVPQLKQAAKRQGHKGTYKLRKPELIHLLETGELLDMSGRVEGARVFEPDEVKSISDSFQGKYATRDKAIFLLGLCIGSRVSELAQLKVADVWRGKPVSTILIRAETAKRKKARRVPIDVNPIAQNIISEFIAWKQATGESIEPDAPLFTSQKGGHLKRVQIHRILKRTYEEAGIEPERASTHSMRKTAATWLYEVTRDIKCVQDFLGHSDSETTEQYIDLAFRVVREGVAQFSQRLSGVFEAEKDGVKNDTKVEILLHFSDDALIIPKERYYRLLEIESQYQAQQQETRRLQAILEEVISHFEDNSQKFEDDPKIIAFRKHLERRLG